MNIKDIVNVDVKGVSPDTPSQVTKTQRTEEVFHA